MSRRGRKRLAVKRYPNGHVAEPRQRDVEQEARQVGTEARERVYGLPRAAAGLSEAGDALGRAFLRGKISEQELKAGYEYENIKKAAQAALLVKQMGSSGDLSRGRGYDGDDGADPVYVAHCEAVERHYAESRRVLLESGLLSHFAVDCWAIEQKEAWSLLEDLRDGLQALARLYQIQRWLRAS